MSKKKKQKGFLVIVKNKNKKTSLAPSSSSSSSSFFFFLCIEAARLGHRSPRRHLPSSVDFVLRYYVIDFVELRSVLGFLIATCLIS